MHQRRSLELFAHYLAPLWPGATLLTALVVAGVLLQLASPQILRSFIDATQQATPMDALGSLAVLYLAVELVRRGAAVGATYAGAAVGGLATNALRSDLLRHCLLLDMPFHKRHSPGELVERLSGDVGALANFFSQFAVRLASNALLVIGILALLFREDWRVGTGLTAYAALTFAVLRALQPLGVRRRAAAREAAASQSAFLEEHLRGTEDVRANGAEPYVLARADVLSRALLLRQRAAQLVNEATFVASNFLFVAGTAVGLVLGAVLYARGEATVGTAFLIVSYARMLFGPLERIREQAQDFQGASASIGRIDVILSEQGAVTDRSPSERRSLPEGPLGLTFDRVSFRYDDGIDPSRGAEDTMGAQDDRARALRDVSFSLAPGRVLGLLGRTGSGKTTLTRLLFRLYDPTEGSIRLGAADLREVPLAELRRRVALVTQDVQLFWGTVRDNVTLFDRAVPDERVVAALTDVGLEAWYRALPQGLDTVLAAGGSGAHDQSGGEAQLLAFARVFLKDPDIVVLDEPSSRLDPATERLLQRATDRLLARRTGIVIAHRLETVRSVDDVLVLEDGRTCEHGRREALERDPSSRYAQLLRGAAGSVVGGAMDPADPAADPSSLRPLGVNSPQGSAEVPA